MAEVKTFLGKSLTNLKTINCRAFANIKSFCGCTIPHGTTLKNQLLACWEFNETSGYTIVDSAGLCDVTNGVGEFHNYSWNINQSCAKLGTCFTKKSTLSVGHAGDVFRMGTSDWSMASWFKVATSNQYIICKGRNASLAYYYGLYVDSNGKLNVTIRPGEGSSANKTVTSTTSISTTGWNHAIATVDRDGYLRLYLNNIEEGSAVNISATSSVNMCSDQEFALGCYYQDGSYSLGVDAIDQTALWSRVLTSDERATLYNSGNGLAYSAW